MEEELLKLQEKLAIFEKRVEELTEYIKSHRHAVEGRRCYKDHDQEEYGCTTTEPLTPEEYQKELPPTLRDKSEKE